MPCSGVYLSLWVHLVGDDTCAHQELWGLCAPGLTALALLAGAWQPRLSAGSAVSWDWVSEEPSVKVPPSQLWGVHPLG